MKDSRLLTFASTIFDISKYALIAVVVLITVFILVGAPLVVDGQSMVPNFQNREVVVVNRLSYMGSKPIARGDVVAARFPADPTKTKLIKRVVGLPGETVVAKDGQITVNGQVSTEPYQPILGTPPYAEQGQITLKSDEYFLAGDNRPGSSDSRFWGPVVRADIIGRVSYIIFPFNSAQYINRISE
jgi:signal peptidase I